MGMPKLNGVTPPCERCGGRLYRAFPGYFICSNERCRALYRQDGKVTRKGDTIKVVVIPRPQGNEG